MSKKAFGFMMILVLLVLVVPAGANGPLNEKQDASVVTLTDMEIKHVVFLREEEKLARDVYLTLSDHYPDAIFANISESEQRHMDAVKQLLDKHGIADPVENDAVGAFTNPDFSRLYEDLVAKGRTDYCEALLVGVFIEELDIDDIEHALNDVVSRDIIRIFNNLLSGSYNHLNAFESRYEAGDCE